MKIQFLNITTELQECFEKNMANYFVRDTVVDIIFLQDAFLLYLLKQIPDNFYFNVNIETIGMKTLKVQHTEFLGKGYLKISLNIL